MPDFLFEVGLEEIPARMIAAAEIDLAGLVEGVLLAARLTYDANAVKHYSTPRRLTVFIPGIASEQAASEELLIGPSAQIAFKADTPTAAAYAFAKKAGVDVSHLSRITTSKGDYVAVTMRRPGRPTIEILAEQIPGALSKLYWPKNMYWRAGKPERFVRPVRWLLALLDDQVVPLEFAGVVACNKTYGHRILHGDQPIEIAHPFEYLAKLEAAYVVPEVESRRQKIRRALDAAARTVPGLRWREDHALVDTVTHLTEWPSVVLGNFQSEYLTLPEEVLVTVMRDHQKYFALEDSAGKLAPYFLTVLNTDADDQGQAIIRHGNERVLKSRFSDARFFWDFDQRTPLADRVEMLKSVTFHKDLGSYYDKTKRNEHLSDWIIETLVARGATIERNVLFVAAEYAKTDLTTELVKEFTELQGIVGGLYARAQHLGEGVAEVIYWQYSPASANDPIPPTIEGQIFGLVDRLDTLVEMFGINLEPTGSKDPFALRRAGNAIISILADSKLPITLADVRQCSAMLQPEETATKVGLFLRERLDFYLRETRGFSYDVVAATLAAGEDNIPDAIARAEALTAVRGSEDFAAIAAAFKRIKNILRQAAERGHFSPGDSTEINEALLTDPAERTLYAESTMLAAVVEQLRTQQKYTEALEQIAILRPHVDRFFDAVMVMAPEPEIRQNRLALIESVLREFSRIADFSEIVTP